jgi:hypothetical protein
VNEEWQAVSRSRSISMPPAGESRGTSAYCSMQGGFGWIILALFFGLPIASPGVLLARRWYAAVPLGTSVLPGGVWVC